MNDKKIAVLIPAYNEEKTIASVMLDFHKACPQAKQYIIDNNSADQTKAIIFEIIETHVINAEYIFEGKQGKGAAVRTGFRLIDADIIVLVDADCTYQASDLEMMLSLFEKSNADMLVGDRLSHGKYREQNKRLFHNFGNDLVRNIINYQYKSNINDVMTGYRIISGRFKNHYSVIYDGFQLETDMTIHALDKNLRIVEVPIQYLDRPDGSESKLSTYRDGVKVILAIVNLFRYYKPMIFFASISSILLMLSLTAGILPVKDYIDSGYVYHVPLAILASSLAVLAMLTAIAGVILDAIARNNRISFDRSWSSKL
jgi:glycosyltransferase involved in cell wall biosynthesis